MGGGGASEPDASEERVMETPYWMCFECDHKQKESSPCGCCPECEECGGPCEEVGGSDEFVNPCKPSKMGDDEVDAAGVGAALRDGHLVEVYETDDLVEIVRLAKEWMAEPSFSEATKAVQDFTVGLVKQLEGGEQ